MAKNNVRQSGKMMPKLGRSDRVFRDRSSSLVDAALAIATISAALVVIE